MEFPIKNGGSFQFAMLNYQRVNHHFYMVYLQSLVGGLNPSEKYLSMGRIIPYIMEKWNTATYCNCNCCCCWLLLCGWRLLSAWHLTSWPLPWPTMANATSTSLEIARHPQRTLRYFNLAMENPILIIDVLPIKTKKYKRFPVTIPSGKLT